MTLNTFETTTQASNEVGSQGEPRVTGAARVCPGCSGTSALRDHDAGPGVLRCTSCGRRWVPGKAAPLEARPEPEPSDAVTQPAADVVAAALAAGVLAWKGKGQGKVITLDGRALAQSERAAVEAVEQSADLHADLAARLAALADGAEG